MTRKAPSTAFKAGVSGNPGGRPKVVGEIKDLARQYTNQAVDALVEVLTSSKSPAAAVVAAATALLDRGYGKPTMHIEADVTIANALADRLAAARMRDEDTQPAHVTH